MVVRKLVEQDVDASPSATTSSAVLCRWLTQRRESRIVQPLRPQRTGRLAKQGSGLQSAQSAWGDGESASILLQ